jgi:hypothetical protein
MTVRRALITLLVGFAIAAGSACVTNNDADYPPVSPGTGELVIRPTDSQPAEGVDTGAFRVVCDAARYAKDDPIVFPGEPGKAHLHLFWGNTAVNASSTNDSLRRSGNSTCAGGIANRSGYWVPTIMDTATGKVVPPTFANMYYKTGFGGVDPRTIQTPPAGLRMIAGDGMDGTQGPDEASYFGCAERYIGNVAALPTQCSASEDMSVTINFPQCWDGRNLDSPDHKSHMAFTSSNNNRGCPASHPVALPAISINARFDVTPSSDLRKWRLSSDMYGTDRPAGLSLHGDWMNGWDQGIFERLVRNCLNRNVDCHGSILEDGTELG